MHKKSIQLEAVTIPRGSKVPDMVGVCTVPVLGVLERLTVDT